MFTSDIGKLNKALGHGVRLHLGPQIHTPWHVHLYTVHTVNATHLLKRVF